MRLTDLIDKEHSFRYLVGFVLALLFFIGVSVPSRSLAGFYANLEGLSDSVERSDFSTAEEQLAEVSAFYEGSRAWGMQGLVDSYLFQDAFLQQASYSYLTRDYQTVVDDLADEVDDPRASELLGSAKFMLARQRYRAIDPESASAQIEKEAIIVEVMEIVNADYERALRADGAAALVFGAEEDAHVFECPRRASCEAGYYVDDANGDEDGGDDGDRRDRSAG